MHSFAALTVQGSLALHHTDDLVNKAAPLPTTREYQHSGDPILSLLRASSKANVPLDDASLALLRLLCTNDARNNGQLQHGRTLAFAQPGEQHDLPAR